MRHDERSGTEGRVPFRLARQLAQRVRMHEIERLQVLRPGRVPGLSGGEPAGKIDQTGPDPRQASDLAEATAVRAGGNLDHPRAWCSVQAEHECQVSQRGYRARPVRAGPEPLSPDDDQVVGPGQQGGDVDEVLRVDARPFREAVKLVGSQELGQLGVPGKGFAVLAGRRIGCRGSVAVARCRRSLGAVCGFEQRLLEPAQQRLGATGRKAQHLGGPAVERGRGAGCDHHTRAEATHRLAQAQVEDRCLLERVALQHQDSGGAVDVRDRCREVGMRERPDAGPRRSSARPRVDVARAERVTEDALDEIALLVRGRAADERARRRSRLEQPRGRRVERLLPRRGPEHAAVPYQRLRDALLGGHRLIAPASLVAQPPVVDVVVVARKHPLDALVADGELDVALARAEVADRPGALDVPRPCAEAVGGVRERPDGAQLDHVPGERRDVGMPVERADEGVVGALQEHELVVLRDLLREAHAPVTEDAALAVDRDQGRERDRLWEVPFLVDEAAAARAPAVGDVLERALAALVAHRAVERVVHEQELDDRTLRVLHPVGLGVDHHPVLDRCGAGGLQLRDPLHLDHAHAARAHRRSELLLVTEVRDLDVAALRRVDEPFALGRAHLAAVDRKGDPVAVGHYAASPEMESGEFFLRTANCRTA